MKVGFIGLGNVGGKLAIGSNTIFKIRVKLV